MINKILVITPIKHISGVSQTLKSIGEVTFLDDPSRMRMLLVLFVFKISYISIILFISNF